VLRAALVIVDKGGLEALTMRYLGRALGVEAMSLYNHVANKEDVLDGLIDLIFSEGDSSRPQQLRDRHPAHPASDSRRAQPEGGSPPRSPADSSRTRSNVLEDDCQILLSEW